MLILVKDCFIFITARHRTEVYWSRANSVPETIVNIQLESDSHSENKKSRKSGFENSTPSRGFLISCVWR